MISVVITKTLTPNNTSSSLSNDLVIQYLRKFVIVVFKQGEVTISCANRLFKLKVKENCILDSKLSTTFFSKIISTPSDNNTLPVNFFNLKTLNLISLQNKVLIDKKKNKETSTNSWRCLEVEI